MNKLKVFVMLFLLFSSFVFASDIGKGKLDNVDYKNGEAVYKLNKDNITADITTEKLSNSKYKISVGTSKLLELEMRNSIDYSTNRFLDCTGGYTCDMVMRLKVSQAMKFDNGQIGGGWQDGQASVSKIYYLKNRTISGQYTDMNGSTQTYSYVETYQETNLDTLTVSKDKYVDLYIRFTRTLLQEVDIYPIIFGHEYKDWSVWGVGGTEYTILDGGINYTVHTFTSDGWFNTTTTFDVEVLIVAGGGGAGGRHGGGGGAGGVIHSTSYSASGNISVYVGAGGLGAVDGGADTIRYSGNWSAFGTLNATGGGAGGSSADSLAENGGSGGGGGGYVSPESNYINGGTSVSGQGYNGSRGYAGAGYCGGGGGGTNATGADATTTCTVGVGGVGNISDINGTNVTYATGGDGGKYTPASGAGANAAANTGDGGEGGGGDAGSGGNGGSGIIIIRYETPSPSIVPSILNSTNGTLFYTENTLFGWSNLTDDYKRLWNVSCQWYMNDSSYSSEVINNVQSNSSGNSSNICNISSGVAKNQNWTLEMNASSGADTIAKTNSSTITIQNSNPIISAFVFTTNGSAYLFGEVEVNVSVTDIDTQDTLTLKSNFFKNNVNQTTLASSTTVISGAVTTINANQSLYTAGDNWSIRVWATDGTNTTPYNNSANTTIQPYFTNVLTNYTASQYDVYNYAHYLNLTTPFTNVTARVFFNSASKAATCAGTTNKTCSVTLTPPIVSNPTNYSVIWQTNLTIANGSVYTTNTSYNITVNPGGLYKCNSSITNTAIVFKIYDAVNSSAVNSTTSQVFYFTTQNGSTKTISLSATNDTIYTCVAPYNVTLNITTMEVYTSSGYQPATLYRSFTVSNVSQNASAYLYPTSYAVTTQLKVIRAPNNAVADVNIQVQKFTAPSYYTPFTTCITTSSGTCSVFLYPNVDFYYYILNDSGTIYNFGAEVLTCDAGAATCYRTFTLGAISNPPILSGNITGSCSYDNTTNLLTCTGADGGATASTFNLLVQQIGNATLICNGSTTANPATLACTLPNLNSTFGYSFYARDSTGNFYPIASGLIADLYSFRDRFGSDAWLAALIIFMVLVGAFSQNLWLSLLAGVVGIGIAMLIGFLPLGVMIPVIIALAVIVVVVGRKLVV